MNVLNDASLTNQLLISLCRRIEKLEHKLDQVHAILEGLSKRATPAIETQVEQVIGNDNGAALPVAVSISTPTSSRKSSMSEHEDIWTVLGDYPHNK